MSQKDHFKQNVVNKLIRKTHKTRKILLKLNLFCLTANGRNRIKKTANNEVHLYRSMRGQNINPWQKCQRNWWGTSSSWWSSPSSTLSQAWPCSCCWPQATTSMYFRQTPFLVRCGMDQQLALHEACSHCYDKNVMILYTLITILETLL